MKEETDIDALITAAVKSEGPDSPDKGFADKVMATLQKNTAKGTAYKPLLPSKIFAGIFLLAVLIVVFLLLAPNDYSQTLFSTTIFERTTDYLSALSFHMEWPANISYIIISASLLLLIQAILFSRIFRRIYR